VAATARNASSKIAAVLPKGRRDEMDAIGLFVIPRSGEAAEDRVLGTLRRAQREERQVWLGYRDKAATTIAASASMGWRRSSCSRRRYRSPGGPCSTVGRPPATCPTSHDVAFKIV